MTEEITPVITEAVADARGVAPEELDITLYDHIDLEALDQLARHDNSTWTVCFELPGHTVTVKSDGTVLVDDSHQEKWMVP